jgi:hypothetical protein
MGHWSHIAPRRLGTCSRAFKLGWRLRADNFAIGLVADDSPRPRICHVRAASQCPRPKTG